ncbi:MAG: Peptidase, partial [Candidatus Eremiobacteraeota bacterium]|nr:Peptidase [Candidatus Eremiobacteraeota bacterium]
MRVVLTASRGFAAEEYLDGLREAGAEPVRIDPDGDARGALAGAGGVLISGGVDVDPASYGAPASPFVSDIE